METLHSIVAGQPVAGTGAEHIDENPARPDEALATWRAPDLGPAFVPGTRSGRRGSRPRWIEN